MRCLYKTMGTSTANRDLPRNGDVMDHDEAKFSFDRTAERWLVDRPRSLVGVRISGARSDLQQWDIAT